MITGASRGIGAACAEAFRRRGARLALVSRDEARLREVARQGDLVCAGDLTIESVRSQAVAETVRRFGTIDVLVNNAGVGLYAPATGGTSEQARALFEVNFFVPLEMARLVAPVMKKARTGTIVNVSSIGGQITLPWFPLYSASKQALCAVTDGLRMELKRDGVHAMAVCPGYVDTEFQRHVIAGKPPQGMLRRRPLSITATECAEAIVRGVERQARTVVTPRIGWLAVAAWRVSPRLVEWQLERMLS